VGWSYSVQHQCRFLDIVYMSKWICCLWTIAVLFTVEFHWWLVPVFECTLNSCKSIVHNWKINTVHSHYVNVWQYITFTDICYFASFWYGHHMKLIHKCIYRFGLLYCRVLFIPHVACSTEWSQTEKITQMHTSNLIWFSDIRYHLIQAITC